MFLFVTLAVVGIAIILILHVVFDLRVLWTCITSDTFCFERTERMHALPEQIFPYLNDFHTWVSWFPNLFASDSDSDIRYGGTPSGIGAVCEWQWQWNGAPDEVHQGRLEIVHEIKPISLTIDSNFNDEDKIQFALRPGKGFTDVTVMAICPVGTNKNIGIRKKILLRLLNVSVYHLEKMRYNGLFDGLSTLKGIVERPTTIGS